MLGFFFIYTNGNTKLRLYTKRKTWKLPYMNSLKVCVKNTGLLLYKNSYRAIKYVCSHQMKSTLCQYNKDIVCVQQYKNPVSMKFSSEPIFREQHLRWTGPEGGHHWKKIIIKALSLYRNKVIQLLLQPPELLSNVSVYLLQSGSDLYCPWWYFRGW